MVGVGCLLCEYVNWEKALCLPIPIQYVSNVNVKILINFAVSNKYLSVTISKTLKDHVL